MCHAKEPERMLPTGSLLVLGAMVLGAVALSVCLTILALWVMHL